MTERYGLDIDKTLKDRLWEIKETLLLPRKCLSASERHLWPQAMQKGYKNPIPILTHGTTGPPAVPIMQPFSSLQVKSFQPLLLESACAFILRVSSRTLST
jgi:hypothetical protein